jgi:GTPase
MEKCCHGKSGEHLYISVPLNTLIKKPSADELRPSKKIIWELKRHGEMFIAARGGAGGHGNAFYLSNMVRKPLKAEEGGRGEKVQYKFG